MSTMRVEAELSPMLVRLAEELMVLGIGVGELYSLMKQAYVTAAEENLATAGRVTVSAVAIMTGLDRREARRLLKLREPARPMRGHSQRIGRVAAHWRTSPVYNPEAQDPPPALPLEGPGSLRAVIRGSAGDVPWVTVRSAMEAAGMLRVEETGGSHRATLLHRPGSEELEADLARRLQQMTLLLDS